MSDFDPDDSLIFLVPVPVLATPENDATAGTLQHIPVETANKKNDQQP